MLKAAMSSPTGTLKATPGTRRTGKYFSPKPGTVECAFIQSGFSGSSATSNLKIPFDELLPRVIENAILCVRSGEDEMRLR